jgi:hypothetical protein
MQTLIGLAGFAAWVGISLWVMEEDVATAIGRVIPFVVIYELGVLSRYFPGVRQAAKSLEDRGRSKR